MRKIEKQMIAAIKSKKNFVSANTAVWFLSAGETGNPYGARSEIFLHGNHIANYWHETCKIDVNIATLLNWPTVTTKSRLRAIGVNITTKKGQIYIDGKPIAE